MWSTHNTYIYNYNYVTHTHTHIYMLWDKDKKKPMPLPRQLISIIPLSPHLFVSLFSPTQNQKPSIYSTLLIISISLANGYSFCLLPLASKKKWFLQANDQKTLPCTLYIFSFLNHWWTDIIVLWCMGSVGDILVTCMNGKNIFVCVGLHVSLSTCHIAMRIAVSIA